MIRTFYFPIGDFEPNIDAAAPLQGRIPRPGRRRVRPAGTAAEFRAVCARARLIKPVLALESTLMAAISIRNLVKRYGNFTVVPDLSLEIADHEFVVFVGPSGCGKSTLLRIIAGLEPITGGELYHRRQARQRRSGRATRHRHGVSGLRAVSAHARLRQHGVCARTARHAESRKSTPGSGRRRPCCTSSPISTASRRNSPAASASASPWAGPSCATRKVFLFDEPLSNLDAKLRGAGAGGDQGAVATAQDHDGLRHPRPDRGHDDGRQHRGSAGRHRAAIRHARRWSTNGRPTSSSPDLSARRR